MCYLISVTLIVYVYVSQHFTGRWIPNAWPSKTMLENSPFVLAAVNKPFYYYVQVLCEFTPCHVIGVLFALILGAMWCACVVCQLCVKGSGGGGGGDRNHNTNSTTLDTVNTDASTATFNATVVADGSGLTAADATALAASATSAVRRRKPTALSVIGVGTTNRVTRKSTKQHTIAATESSATTTNDTHEYVTRTTASKTSHLLFTAKIVVFSLWPASYLFCLTVLGAMGAGFQSRFLMPMLPATAILCAIAVHSIVSSGSSDSTGGSSGSSSCSSNVMYATVCNTLFTLCIIYSTLHTVYYGILYAPLYAELEYSVRDVLIHILTHNYHSPQSRESFQDTLKFMEHFGLMGLMKK